MKDVLSGTVATRLHFLLALGLSYSIGVVETLSLASSALRLLLVLFRLSQRNRAEASKPCRQWSRCLPCAIVRNLFQSPGLHAHATQAASGHSCITTAAAASVVSYYPSPDRRGMRR